MPETLCCRVCTFSVRDSVCLYVCLSRCLNCDDVDNKLHRPVMLDHSLDVTGNNMMDTCGKWAQAEAYALTACSWILFRPCARVCCYKQSPVCTSVTQPKSLNLLLQVTCNSRIKSVRMYNKMFKFVLGLKISLAVIMCDVILMARGRQTSRSSDTNFP